MIQSQLIDVIPIIEAKEDGKDRILPPVIEKPIIRKSGPQTAFIVENNDPKNQGRVRIAFPWQAVGDPQLKQELQEAKDDLKEKTNITEQAKTKQDQLQQKLELLQGQNKALSALQTELEKEPDAKKQKELLKNKYDKKRAQLNANTWTIKRQKNRSDQDIETTKDLLKDATKEVGAAQKEQDEANAAVEQLTKKWNTMLSEVASPWVRVAMPMATAEGGMYFKPRPGDEVIVNFRLRQY